MADNDNAGTVAMAPVRTDVRSVEKELAGLWQKAAEGGLPGVASPSTRVILSNIIVYAETHEESDEASEVVLAIAARHPARTIITDAEPGEAGNELDADVSMLCNVSDFGRRLCGEEVRLHAHGITVTALGTILPVIVPDLPIYLWTPGDLKPGDPVYRQMMNIPDHWIVDSRRFSSRRDRFQMIKALGIERVPAVIVHDLAWSSLVKWREVVARHFDLRPARQYLQGISSVKITGAEQDGKPSIESLLMASWLISRLNLRNPKAKRSGKSLSITTESDGGTVEFRLTASSNTQTALRSIVIESKVDGKSATFASTRAAHSMEITSEAHGADLPEIRSTAVIEPESRGRELCGILDAPDREWIYEASLKVIEQVLMDE